MNTPDQPTATATPRTDAQPLVKIYDRAGMPYDSELVDPNFARTLERELSSAQAALAEAKAELWAFQRDLAEAKRIQGIELGRLRDLVVRTEKAEAELAAAKAEVARLNSGIVTRENVRETQNRELTALRAEVERLNESLIAILSNTEAANAKQHASVAEMMACMMVQNWRTEMARVAELEAEVKDAQSLKWFSRCRELEQDKARLVTAMCNAIREARTLEANTDPLVDDILQPAINAALDAAKGQP